MSRRSILLATTFYIAIGSLVAVGPALAHSFGGFGGGQTGNGFAGRSPSYSNFARVPIQSSAGNVGGTSMNNMGSARFGHPPSVSAPAADAAGARLQPSRLPATANAPLTNMPAARQAVRPVQLPQTITSSGLDAPRHVDAAGIVRPIGSVATQIQNSAEGRGKLQKPGSNAEVPDVTGPARTVFGKGSSDNGHGLGGAGVNIPDGPNINLPGSVRQKGPPAVPGTGDGMAGASHLNLPGSVDQHNVGDASKKLSEAEVAGKDLLNQASKGGLGALNLPSSAGAGVAVSDDENGKNTVASTAGQSVSGTGSAAAAGKVSGAGLGNSSIKIAPGIYGSTGGGQTKDGGSQTVSTMQDGKTVFQVVTTKDAAGNITSIGYQENKAGKVTEKSSGPLLTGKKKNETPNDDDTGSTGSLSPTSGIAKRDNGGGTDNNGTESSGGQSTQLANGSAIGRRGNGDGTGGQGDNDGVGNDGALASGSVLARKNYGDGGGSDTRDGGTSLGNVKVHSGGGDPHQ